MPGLDEEQITMWGYWAPDEDPKLDTSKLPISRLPAIFAETMGQEPDPDLYAKLIKEEYYEFMEEEWGTVGELKELADLVYVIYGYAHGNGWDLDEAIRRVHDNNIGRCIQPDGSIKRREDGKIMKNPDYPKVELGDLV
jgi:hypothetical protein